MPIKLYGENNIISPRGPPSPVDALLDLVSALARDLESPAHDPDPISDLAYLYGAMGVLGSYSTHSRPRTVPRLCFSGDMSQDS